MEKVRPLAEIFWRVSVRWWESYRNLMIAVERFMTTFCKFELIDDGETEGGVLIMEMAIVSFSRLLLEVGQSRGSASQLLSPTVPPRCHGTVILATLERWCHKCAHFALCWWAPSSSVSMRAPLSAARRGHRNVDCVWWRQTSAQIVRLMLSSPRFSK